MSKALLIAWQTGIDGFSFLQPSIQKRESVMEDPPGDPTISVPCTGGMSTESTAKVGKLHCSACLLLAALLAEDYGWVGGGKGKKKRSLGFGIDFQGH